MNQQNQQNTSKGSGKTPMDPSSMQPKKKMSPQDDSMDDDKNPSTSEDGDMNGQQNQAEPEADEGDNKPM